VEVSVPYHIGFAIREIPKRTWQGGSPRHEGDRWQCTRGFGTRGFVLHEVCDNTTADFPIGKSPTQEKVDPLTIGVRDLEGPVHGAAGLANSRPTISRFPQVGGPKPLNIASSKNPDGRSSEGRRWLMLVSQLGINLLMIKNDV
jgi:hypothetical protein